MRRGGNQRSGAAGRARSGGSGARPSPCQAEALAEGAVSARPRDVIATEGGRERGGGAAWRPPGRSGGAGRSPRRMKKTRSWPGRSGESTGTAGGLAKTATCACRAAVMAYRGISRHVASCRVVSRRPIALPCLSVTSYRRATPSCRVTASLRGVTLPRVVSCYVISRHIAAYRGLPRRCRACPCTPRAGGCPSARQRRAVR